MAWTAATRGDYVRPSGSYASDVTDREWALIAPSLPAALAGGRPRRTCLRRVVNAVERRGNRLVAHIGSDYGGLAREREID